MTVHTGNLSCCNRGGRGCSATVGVEEAPATVGWEGLLPQLVGEALCYNGSGSGSCHSDQDSGGRRGSCHSGDGRGSSAAKKSANTLLQYFNDLRTLSVVADLFSAGHPQLHVHVCGVWWRCGIRSGAVYNVEVTKLHKLWR